MNKWATCSRRKSRQLCETSRHIIIQTGELLSCLLQFYYCDNNTVVLRHFRLVILSLPLSRYSVFFSRWQMFYCSKEPSFASDLSLTTIQPCSKYYLLHCDSHKGGTRIQDCSLVKCLRDLSYLVCMFAQFIVVTNVTHLLFLLHVFA